MNALLQLLPRVLFLFFFPIIIQSKKSCPASSCGSNSYYLQVKYPFKLDTDRPLKHCKDYITLRCNDQGQTILDLPSYGDFIVDSFEYYYYQSITLKDLDDCLPRRFMNNLSLYPFKARYNTNYTFYTCPRKAIEQEQIPYIKCMSNSTNVTIAQPGSYHGLPDGCETLVSLLLPITPAVVNSHLGISDVVQLTWNVSDCKDCISGFAESGDDDSGKRWSKFFLSPLFILSVVVSVALFSLASLRLVQKFTGGRQGITETRDNTTNMNGNDAESTTTEIMPADQNEGSSRVGQGSKVNRPCTEIIVVDDTHSKSLPNAETSCCSICLEDYQGKDKVRYLSQCGHYFHAQCVDQWLHKNTTCPVCRDKLSASIL